MASDSDFNQLKLDIQKSVEDEEQSVSAFIQKIQNKDVAVFLGNTRSGKSTLVNYIIGTKLEGLWDNLQKEFKIKKTDSNTETSIGQGTLSSTTKPNVYLVLESRDVIVDLPGFEDNRGEVRDILNSLYINQIKVARTVKFIVIVDINDIIHDNIRNFTSSLQQLEALVRNFDKLKKSFAFMFTKDCKKYTQAEIVELLQNKILKIEELNVNKTLIENLVDSKELIGIFKMPTKTGEITNELDLNVKGAIKACHAVDARKCDIKFALSEKTQEILLEIYQEYTDTNYFKNELNKLIEKYADYFDVNKYVYASWDDELSTTTSALGSILSSLKTLRNETPKYLSEIETSLNSLLQNYVSEEFGKKFKFVVVLDKYGILREEPKNQIIKNYNTLLSELYQKIEALVRKIDEEQIDRNKSAVIFGGTFISSGALSAGATAAIRSATVAVETSETAADAVAAATETAAAAVTGTAATAVTETAITAATGSATTGMWWLTACKLAAVGGAGVAVGAGGYYIYQEYIKRWMERKAQKRCDDNIDRIIAMISNTPSIKCDSLNVHSKLV